MRGLTIALQGKYAALMQRVDQLAAMPDRGTAVTRFPARLGLLWHFFDQPPNSGLAPSPRQTDLLGAPILPPDEDAEGEGLLLRQWRARRYLLRMANSPNSQSSIIAFL